MTPIQFSDFFWGYPDDDDVARFTAVRELYIALTRHTEAAPCAGMLVAKLMQAMRRRGLKTMAVRDIGNFVFDVHPDDMVTMLDAHVRAGLARWFHSPVDNGKITRITAFEPLD